jgi:ubiquinone biosynthesis protein COQ4
MGITLSDLEPGGRLYLPVKPSWTRRLRVGVPAVRALIADPTDALAAYVFVKSMDGDLFERKVTQLLETNDGRELLQERPDLEARALDIEKLASLPEGTFGHALAQYYAAQGIGPFAQPHPVRTDADYLKKRNRDVHDILHLITGYRTDHVGEMELQAFMLGNARFRYNAMALLSGVPITPREAIGRRAYARRLVAAYRRGRRTPDLTFGPRYERYWSSTLDEVRRRVGLVSPS